MRKLISTSFVASLILVSACADESNVPVITSENAESSEIQGNAIATIEIEGMMCELGCGAEIRKHLKETNTIISCSFDFDENRKVNTAKIEFDNTKTDANELAKVIRQIDDRRFKTGEVSAKSKDVKANTESTDQNMGGSIVNVSETSLEFPNIFEFISGFGL